MAKRNFLLDFLVLLLLCLLRIDAVAASSPKSLAKPNCTGHCGDMTIPFPFGRDRRECFLNEWYEIDCRNENVTYLMKLDLQVLHISFPGYENMIINGRFIRVSKDPLVAVKFPINDSDCPAQASSPPRSLEGSPFAFSYSENAFTAVGCSATAMMNSSDDSLVGCRLQYCTGGNPGKCNATVPSGLQSFAVEFINNNNNRKDATETINGTQCNYAFLANESWLESSSSALDSVRKEGHAPVALDWGIFNDSDLGIELYNNDSYSIFSYFDTYDNRRIYGYGCLPGYEGNPYFDGCHDVDECEDPTNRCPGRCVNKPGHYNCEDPHKMLKLIMIGIGSTIGALLLVLLGWWLYQIIKKRKEKKLKEKCFKRNGGLLLQQHLLSPNGNLQKGKLFVQKDLEKATENFSENRVLGKGGQGTVYKGMLTDGRIVAVKKALVIDEENVEQFINEVMILSQINHRNIVILLGCCLETEIPLLVYEFIPNGNLYEYLHESNNEYLVSWEVRLQLAVEIAGALCYLHSAASMPIYHRDIKSTNILLDEKYRVKIADFGTSRSVSLDQTHVTTLIQGTVGYLDPEFFQTYQFTDKSDVYSFGVVLVELLTREKPISAIRMDEGRNLATHFILSVDDGHLLDILDAQILNEGTQEEILLVANLARRCLYLSGKNRPTMREVAIELEGIKKLQQLPNIQESGENRVKDQCQDIFKSPSTRIKFETNFATSSDVQPLLLSRT